MMFLGDFWSFKDLAKIMSVVIVGQPDVVGPQVPLLETPPLFRGVGLLLRLLKMKRSGSLVMFVAVEPATAIRASLAERPQDPDGVVAQNHVILVTSVPKSGEPCHQVCVVPEPTDQLVVLTLVVQWLSVSSGMPIRDHDLALFLINPNEDHISPFHPAIGVEPQTCPSFSLNLNFKGY